MGLAVAVAAHLALAAAGDSLYVRDPGYADRAIRLTRVEQSVPPGTPLVLMLGTSRTGNGFHAARSATRAVGLLGRPVTAFNFGTPASGPITHRVHLARLLADGHRPALVLVEVLPPVLADLKGGPIEGRFLNGGRFRREELDVLASYGIPATDLRRQWRATFVEPWNALRFPLLGRVLPGASPDYLRSDDGRNTDTHGWIRIWEEIATPESMAAGAARARRDYEPVLADLHPGGGAGRALADTLALARDHGIPTRLVLMPESEWFRALYPPGVAARFDAWLATLAREAGCPVTDARGWIPDAGFADGHHLFPSGAEPFTDRLADEVIVPHLRDARGRSMP